MKIKSQITKDQIEKTRKLSLIAAIDGLEIHEDPICGDTSTIIIYNPESGDVFDSGYFDWPNAKQDILDGSYK